MHFDKPAYLMAHERSIAALKREIGPNFDLSALWDEHVRHEFDTRDVAATMATMVAEPTSTMSRPSPAASASAN